MRIVLYASILPSAWKKEYRTQGIKRVENVSDLYAQQRDGKGGYIDIKDAILTQATPFWILFPNPPDWSNEVVIQFSKELKDIYVDFGDEPSAYADQLMPECLEGEEELTYEKLDVEKFLKQSAPLYGSWVKEIRPEEIMGVYRLKHNSQTQLVDGEEVHKWMERQPRVIK